MLEDREKHSDYDVGEESIDDILKSIRNLVYSEKEEASFVRGPIIDLNRPVAEEEVVIQSSFENTTEGRQDSDTSASKEAVGAMSSFFHHLHNRPSKEEKVNVQSSRDVFEGRSAEPLKVVAQGSVGLEEFLHGLISPVLQQEVEKYLQKHLPTVLQDVLAQKLEVLVQEWLNKQGSMLVVKCVEVYLKEVSKAASH